MDFGHLILAAVAVLALVGLGVALLVRGRAAAPVNDLSDQQTELIGRMKQLAESQAAAQTQLSERLQAQERALSRTLEERLADVTKRVGDSLREQTTHSQTTMGELKERLAVIDAAQQNITKLSSEVVGLQDILSNKQARGAFGEIQLNDLVSAVLPPSAYAFQATLSNGRRVDCLLTLPNPPGAIAIDAKFPLESYNALHAAADEAERTRAKKQFSTDVLAHVRDIAAKYIVPGETAESALMFLPSEAVYAELHANFSSVVEQSFRARVFIVSPTTLWATLNTVRAVLKDAHMSEQAGLIQVEVLRMLEDVGRLGDRVGNLERHFDLAVKDLGEIRTSTEKIQRRGGRIEEMELGEEAADEEAGEEAIAPPEQRLRAEAD